MPCNFFNLPPEVRNIIYDLLFVSDHPQRHVTPDMEGWRHDNGMHERALKLSDCLPLLRTCQHVHEEATSVLYGNNHFFFSDEPLGEEEHHVAGFGDSVPKCDFVTMYGFFSRIGSRYRKRIQHLRLQFESDIFFTYLDEHHDLPYPELRYGGAASFLGEALDLLSSDHNILTFELSSAGPEHWYDNPFMTLCSDADIKLFKIMKQFKNVRNVNMLPIRIPSSVIMDPGCLSNLKDEHRLLRAGFDRLKAEMEAADPAKITTEWRRFVISPTKYGFNLDPIDQTTLLC